MYNNIRIQTCSIGYVIQVKKHWWSTWKSIWFGNNQSDTVKTANGMLLKMYSKPK